jgi:hypothetical protein
MISENSRLLREERSQRYVCSEKPSQEIDWVFRKAGFQPAKFVFSDSCQAKSLTYHTLEGFYTIEGTFPHIKSSSVRPKEKKGDFICSG